MAKGISLSVATDTRDFSKGVKNGIIEPLEDAADTLKDLAKEGDKAGDKLEDGFKKARRETEDLKDEYKQLGKTISAETRKGSKSMADNSREGTSKAKADLDELGREARANASETFSSFDGSAESFVDGIQGTLGGLIGGLGPIGMAAGAAGALGIGLIMASLDQANVDTEAFREKVGELATEWIESGGTAETSIDFIVDKLKTLATETDDSVTGLDDLAKAADGSGSSFKDLAQVYAGNTKGLKALQKESKNTLDALRDEADATDTSTNAGVDRYSTLQSQIKAQESYNTYVDEAAKVADAAAEAEENYGRSGAAAMEARAEAIDTLQGELDGAIGTYSDFEATEETAINPAGYIEAMQARIDATSGFAGNVDLLAEKFNLSAEEVQTILDQGVDFAPMLQSIIDSGLDAEFIAKMQAAVDGGAEVLDGTTLDTTVDVDADTDEAEDKIDTAAEKERAADIEVKADTKDAKAKVDAFVDKKRSISVDLKLSTGSADKQLKTWLAKNRTISVTANVKDRNGKAID